jgi:hypothetical protein
MRTDEPAPTIRRPNPRLQGEIGLGAAIAWFTANGYCVAIPLADNQPYDLVVDGPDGLQRVEVKTATAKDRRGRFVVDIRTSGGNRSRSTVKHFDPTACDLLFILTDDQRRYVVPVRHLRARAVVVLSPMYDPYVVGGGFEPP